MQITINIPDELAERVLDAGLLNEERVIELFSNELKRTEHLARLRDIVDGLRSVEPPLTLEEIQAELDARKQERLREAGLL